MYVDLNMVRAGVANHPSEWKLRGYHEIQEPKARCRLLDHEEPRRLLEQETSEALAKTHVRIVEGQLIRSKGREINGAEALPLVVKYSLRGCK